MAETIAALATAAVKGAIGVIRISGDTALQVADKVFHGQSLKNNPRKMLYGDFLSHDGIVLDRGLAVYFNAPNSYTGEDVVELFGHGSVTVLGEVLNSLYRAGARPAKPGEYTRRAFLNGKMDLTQAEAVIDLIDAETGAQAKNAAAQLDGAMGKLIAQAREPLVDIASEFYAYVDYPDDDIELSRLDSIITILDDAHAKLWQLAASYEQGRLLRDGISCAIIGKPNVGKSSLLNALLGYERSIVTDIAGTTRDTVEESLNLGGVRLRLIDTAGMHATSDRVEQHGVERARKAVESAELVLAVFDGAQPLDDEDMQVLEQVKLKRSIGVINKSDLATTLSPDDISANFTCGCCVISAKENSGFAALEDMIKRLFAIESIPCTGETVTNPRHAAALRTAAEHVENACTALKNGLTPDVCVSDIQSAINALEELTGMTAKESVLSRIFERFCVGK